MTEKSGIPDRFKSTSGPSFPISPAENVTFWQNDQNILLRRIGDALEELVKAQGMHHFSPLANGNCSICVSSWDWKYHWK